MYKSGSNPPLKSDERAVAAQVSWGVAELAVGAATAEFAEQRSLWPAEARTKERMIAYAAADAVGAEQPSPAEALAGGKALLKLIPKIKSERALIRRDARKPPADGEAGELRAIVEELVGLTELGERPCTEFNPPPRVRGKRARESAAEPITQAPALRTRGAVAHDDEPGDDRDDERGPNFAAEPISSRRSLRSEGGELAALQRGDHRYELAQARLVANQEGWSEGHRTGCAVSNAQVAGLRAQLATLREERAEREEQEEKLRSIIYMLQCSLDDSWEAACEYVGKLGGHVFQTAMCQLQSAPPAGIRFMSTQQLQQLQQGQAILRESDESDSSD